MNSVVDTYDLLRTYTYGMVDPLVTDNCADPSVSLVPQWLSSQAEQLPRLMDLRNLPADAMVALVERMDDEIAAGDVPSLSMLVFADGDRDAAVTHLKDRLTVRLNGKKALLRYYDARVMCHLDWMLDDAEKAWLFGPIRQLAGWAFGRWHIFSRREMEIAHPPTEIQVQRLARIGLINEVLSKSSYDETVTDIATAGRRVEDALVNAEQWALTDEQDQITFAYQAITLAPHFDRHPEVRRLLAERESDISYRDACRMLGLEDWQRIRSELLSLT